MFGLSWLLYRILLLQRPGNGDSFTIGNMVRRDKLTAGKSNPLHCLINFLSCDFYKRSLAIPSK